MKSAFSRAGAVWLTGLALAAAGCGAVAARPGSHRTAPLPAVTAPLPAVTGHGVRVLWQGAPWANLAIAGGLVVGDTQRLGHAVVRAASALTGAARWTATIPRRESQILGLVPGAGVLIVEAGHLTGQAPAMVAPVVSEDIALDLRTGRTLWTAPVTGRVQSPPLAIAQGEVITIATSGLVTARVARTGRVLWHHQRPASCRPPGDIGIADSGAGTGAAGSLLAASFECRGGGLIVQRLDPGTGQADWQWQAPRQAGSAVSLAVAGVASQGGIVLLTGEVAPPSTARALAGRLPRRYFWPASLGPLDDTQVVLALDAGTGQRRWTELGGQLDLFSLADGAVCEEANTGLECRDDVTGQPTRPVLVTGQGENSTPPYVSDGFAGVTGSLAAVTVAPFRSGHVRLQILPVRGARPLATADLAIGVKAYHANYQTFVVAAGALPGGASLILLRRIDQPGYPVIALRAA